jgi:hypothetical protein
MSSQCNDGITGGRIGASINEAGIIFTQIVIRNIVFLQEKRTTDSSDAKRSFFIIDVF